MHQRPALRVLLSAGALATGGLLGGCTVGPDSATAPGGPDGEAVPQAEVDGYAPLTVHLTVPQAEAVPGTSGRPYGCGDLLVPVETVPADAPDDADAALDFLFADGRGSHGDPPLQNAVAGTQDTLTPTGHRREGDTEVFTFTGTVTAEDECAAQRVRAQLHETAAAHTSAGQVRLEVDGRDLDEVLGLPPLVLGDPTSVPEGGAAPATPSEDSWAPAEEPAPEPSWVPEETAAEPAESWAPEGALPDDAEDAAPEPAEATPTP